MDELVEEAGMGGDGRGKLRHIIKEGNAIINFETICNIPFPLIPLRATSCDLDFKNLVNPNEYITFSNRKLFR